MQRNRMLKLLVATAVTLHLAFYFGKPLFMPKQNSSNDKGLTGTQIGVACVLGVLGGIYIWKPLLVQYQAEQHSKETKEK